jgi:hypothetical protein
LHLDDRLAEVSFGEWDGLTLAEIDARWPGQRQSSLRVSWASGCPGAENYDEAADRAAEWLQILSRSAGDRRNSWCHRKPHSRLVRQPIEGRAAPLARAPRRGIRPPGRPCRPDHPPLKPCPQAGAKRRLRSRFQLLSSLVNEAHCSPGPTR